MPTIRRPVLVLSAAVLGIGALGTEPALLRDFSVEAQGSRLVIGAARVPLWGAAFAQTDRVVLENVTLVQGSSTYTAKQVAFSGVASSRADIEAIFDRSAAEPLGARLARINARQIAIPELVADEQIGTLRQRTTYRNVAASDISQGRVANIAVESGTVEREGPTKARSTHKTLTVTGLAAADLARVYFEKAGPQPAPLTKIYDSFAVEGIEHQAGNEPLLRIARVNGRDVLMRPTEESWSGSTSLLTAMAEIDNPSDAETNRLVTAGADLLGAFEIGLLEMHGLDMQGKTDKGEPLSMRLKRVAYAGAGGQPADLRLEGFEMAVKEGTARLATLAFTGFSFEATREGIKALKGKPLDGIDAATLRSLIPTIGTMRLAGLEVDVEDENKRKGPKPERLRFGVKGFELTADKPFNGIPTNIRIATQNLVMPLPATSQEEGIKNLLDLGYKSIDWSAVTALSWNEAAKEILIHEVSGSAVDMLNFKVSGVIGNVTKDVFNADTAVATVAALAATAKRLEVVVENTGFFERYLAQEAKKVRKTPEALRREYGSAAAFAVPAMLGNSEQSKALGQALARFIARPTRLRITAQTKSPEGLGVADVMNVTKPASILERLDLTAATDERL